MSIHHLERAALTKLPSSKKLVFMCIADDADKLTRVAAVGLEAIQEWSGLGKSQALAVIKELVDEGYIARVKAGRKGQRAEFRVFARVACCELHEAFDGPEPATVVGSGPLDPTSDEAPIHAGNQATSDEGSAQPDPNAAIGSGEGSDEGSGLDRTPYVSPVSTPQPPHSGGAVETKSITIPAAAIDAELTAEASAIGVTLVPLATACARHGATLTEGCRGCGTTHRLVESAQRRARTALHRIREQHLTAKRRSEGAAAVPSNDPSVKRRLSAVRDQMRNQAEGKESA